MQFNNHFRLEGKHAFLSPSSPAWTNYTEEKLETRFFTAAAARRGVEEHQLAHDLIRLGVKLPNNKTTLSMYVNDAIGFRMVPEQALYYSENCFGTADAIAFKRNKLRIHDLKTGETHTSERQLEVYVAIFCLEYGMNPFEIETELRIYQSDERRIYKANPGDLMHIMETIRRSDKLINELRAEVLS